MSVHTHLSLKKGLHMSLSSQQRQLTRRTYAFCYTLYAALIALVVLVAFVIWRPTIRNLALAINGPHQANSLIYFVGVLFLGMAGFMLVIAGEPYLRNGLQRGLLMRRFWRLAIPLLIAGAVGIAINLWALDRIDHPAGQFYRAVPGRLQTTAHEAM